MTFGDLKIGDVFYFRYQLVKKLYRKESWVRSHDTTHWNPTHTEFTCAGEEVICPNTTPEETLDCVVDS